MTYKCIVCADDVENWDIAYPEDSAAVHPIGGTVFRTYGHYGSSVFDPMDASYLEIVVCDGCLTAQRSLAYDGVNLKYKQELDENRAEMDKLIDDLNLIELPKD
jgi:hypothetical protein